MITVHGLSMRLLSGGREVSILNDLDLEVPKGQFVAVVGPSGSGKTTLLGLIAGLDQPTTGSVTLDGISLSALSEDELAIARGRLIGFVFQSYHLIPTLTALENVAVPLELIGEDAPLERSRDLLTQVGLGDRLHHYPVQLSGGEQQRVAIARAVACRPPILLVDEPTGNLDTTTSRAIIDLLVLMHREHGSTMVLVTHEEALAAHADRIVTLMDGRITADTVQRPAG